MYTCVNMCVKNKKKNTFFLLKFQCVFKTEVGKCNEHI